MSSYSRNSPVDNDERRGAAESDESQLTEGRGTSTVQDGARAGNGGAIGPDSSAPVGGGDGRGGSAMPEDRAGIAGDDRADDQVGAREGTDNAGGPPAPGPEGRRDGSNGAARPGDEADDKLVLIDNADAFRSQWESVQIGFVDDPRQAVQDAQDLLSSVVDELIDSFRRTLDDTLAGDDDRSTDQLRHTFRRYRVLFERLLST